MPNLKSTNPLLLKIAIGQLCRHGYDIYLPLQRPLYDEVAIDYNGRLSRVLIKNVLLTPDRGPTFKNQLSLDSEKIAIDDLAVDFILAVCCSNQDVWLIPIHEVLGKGTIRLAQRSDWKLLAVSNDYMTPVEKEERIIEKSITNEAEKEQQYYQDLLHKSTVSDNIEVKGLS